MLEPTEAKQISLDYSIHMASFQVLYQTFVLLLHAKVQEQSMRVSYFRFVVAVWETQIVIDNTSEIVSIIIIFQCWAELRLLNYPWHHFKTILDQNLIYSPLTKCYVYL